MSTDFASSADLADKTITFDAIGPDLYAFTAEGDPNSGVIVGDDGVMVVDAQATPVMARQVIDRVAKITDKPIKYVLLTHYHAVRLLGASAYVGAEILASDTTRALIVERGKQDMDSEIGRADGARSTVRGLLGLGFSGVTFEDKFLIADVRMAADFPTERRFWFAPKFHAGQSALMHRQPDNVWRIDLQLGPDADPIAEQEPERVRARLAKALAPQDFELEWVSVYTFNCRRLHRFVHDRVIFIGDAAHQVSPFGARGGNSGIQNAENLAWKLAAMLAGEGGEALIASHDIERTQAADENIGHSTRSTDFMSPHSRAERGLRDAVLALAPKAEFARRMVNSGRLSLPAVYDSPLSTPDEAPFAGAAKLGAPLPDAPVTRPDGTPAHLLENLRDGFELICVKADDDGDGWRHVPDGIRRTVIGEDLFDRTGIFAQRFDATPGAAYLVRPDQHLCARWRRFDASKVAAAHARALGR